MFRVTLKTTLLILSVLGNCMDYTEGRAIMIEPPHRSSLWRFNYNTTVNLRDDSMNCGGYDWQWGVNGGRCGICGDMYNGAQDNDDNGKFATGIIVRSYLDGHYINVTFEVSSNYLGFVEFRLCPRNSTSTKLEQSCFDRYPLWIDESHGTRYHIGSRGGIYDIHIRLPTGLVCKKCVLQWKYKTGYRYNGEGQCKCLGCGKQEQYTNCADIEIRPQDGWTVIGTPITNNGTVQSTAQAHGHTHAHNVFNITPGPINLLTHDHGPTRGVIIGSGASRHRASTGLKIVDHRVSQSSTNQSTLATPAVPKSSNTVAGHIHPTRDSSAANIRIVDHRQPATGQQPKQFSNVLRQGPSIRVVDRMLTPAGRGHRTKPSLDNRGSSSPARLTGSPWAHLNLNTSFLQQASSFFGRLSSSNITLNGIAIRAPVQTVDVSSLLLPLPSSSVTSSPSLRTPSTKTSSSVSSSSSPATTTPISPLLHNVTASPVTSSPNSTVTSSYETRAQTSRTTRVTHRPIEATVISTLLPSLDTLPSYIQPSSRSATSTAEVTSLLQNTTSAVNNLTQSSRNTITLDHIRKEIVSQLGNEVNRGMKVLLSPPVPTPASIVVRQSQPAMTLRPQMPPTQTRRLTHPRARTFGRPSPVGGVRQPPPQRRGGFRTFTERPNTQFVSVSNILDRFLPNPTYVAPLLYSLTRPRRPSRLRWGPGCNVNSDEFRCKARGIYNHSPGISRWCEINCRASNCVNFMCECGCEDISPRGRARNSSSCHAIADFHGVEGMDEWCTANCKRGYCPSNTCSLEDCLPQRPAK